MDGLDEALREFLAESDENLDRVDRDLVASEGARPDRETLDRTFRAVHTIKGTCGFLSLPGLERVSHAGESLLCAVRDGRTDWSPEVASALLRLTGTLRSIIRSVAAGAGEGDGDHAPLIEALDRARWSPSGNGDAPPPEPSGDPQGVEGLTLPGMGNHVRVNVEVLDSLMNLVGELVLARNQLLEEDTLRWGGAPCGPTLRLHHITSALQEGVMKARMQPIGNVWGKFPRVARDLARSFGKRVRLELSGQETELDRTVIEAIRDPLTHLVRNALDHGIETPEGREAAGKPAAGTLRLGAGYENGQVVVEVSDDGAGIDPRQVVRRAVERGLATREGAAGLTDGEVIRWIFLPGFSTADRVTNVSGRGVGMDVVKTNIEAIGGSIDVSSVPGAGTTVRLKIPLTLAITPALIVEAGGDRYAIPQADLRELFQGEARGVEWVHETAVYRHRGELLPLVDLAALLGVGPGLARAGVLKVVVLQADGCEFGLVVSGVVDSQEIVVKPMARLLKGLPYYAGASVMGDGRIALILDAQGLAREANVGASGTRRVAHQGAAAPCGHARPAEPRPHLLGRSGPSGRFAVPLGQVARIKTVSAAAIEETDGQRVVQYRGAVLPLFRVPGGPAEDPPGGDPVRVIVHETPAGPVGFVVDEIIDIVEDVTEVRRASPSALPGRVGTAIARGRVTELVDLPTLLRFHEGAGAPVAAGGG